MKHLFGGDKGFVEDITINLNHLTNNNNNINKNNKNDDNNNNNNN